MKCIAIGASLALETLAVNLRRGARNAAKAWPGMKDAQDWDCTASQHTHKLVRMNCILHIINELTGWKSPFGERLNRSQHGVANLPFAHRLPSGRALKNYLDSPYCVEF